MATSEEERWSLVDGIERWSRYNLEDNDVCYYLLTRHSGSYSDSETNSRINNFQKDPERFRDRPDVLYYKDREIDRFSMELARLVCALAEEVPGVCLVPMPTSRPEADESYDDRLVRLCRKTVSICRERGIERVSAPNVLHAMERTRKSKAGGSRDPATLAKNIRFDGLECDLGLIVLVDDVLTTGAHFAACKGLIRAGGEGAGIVGAFLALEV